jgi:hypothetical protein
MPKQNGSEAQHPLPPDKSPPVSKEEIKHVQQVIGNILYYAHALDLIVLMVLSTIASKQAKGTENTTLKTKQLLEYLATHPDTRHLSIWMHPTCQRQTPTANHAGIFSWGGNQTPQAPSN